ncbi:hypothetical protein ID866_11506 [Astraeus odoratus]|nr:hypothetical protein ID866_11506 [Astraeus odoratus]
MSFPIANPDVYLNYLGPSVANDYELVRNFDLVTFGALVWDILSSMPEDYRLIHTRKFSVTLLAYFVTRPTNLVETVLAILQYSQLLPLPTPSTRQSTPALHPRLPWNNPGTLYIEIVWFSCEEPAWNVRPSGKVSGEVSTMDLVYVWWYRMALQKLALTFALHTAMSFPILNPDVYLNYLTPSVANDYELVRNSNLITFGALVWDILSSMPEDYRLIRTRKFSVTLFAYFVTR